ncbi:NUDIX hydrolase [Micromonospora sp. NPDC004704]
MTQTIADLERRLIATQGYPRRHAEVREEIRAAGFPHLADELDRIAATTAVHLTSRHFTASAAVFDVARGLVLLVDHKLTGRRQFPGGHVDADETGAEAAIREVLEETGVRALLWSPDALTVPGGEWHTSPFMTVEFPAPADLEWGEPAHHHIDLLFLATADSTAPVTAQLDEVDGVAWLPVDTLPAANVRADVPPVAAAAWRALTKPHTVRAEHVNFGITNYHSN